jgi:hypothetical protein
MQLNHVQSMSRISPFLTPLLLDFIDLPCLALEERCRRPSLSGCHSVDHCIHHSTADPGHETLQAHLTQLQLI